MSVVVVVVVVGGGVGGGVGGWVVGVGRRPPHMGRGRWRRGRPQTFFSSERARACNQFVAHVSSAHESPGNCSPLHQTKDKQTQNRRKFMLFYLFIRAS